jgi:CRISPR-associated endonuclease/helicase Cas3
MLLWLDVLEQMFLQPAGLSLQSNPPTLVPDFDRNQPMQAKWAQNYLAGFCSVADWLGSSDRFVYNDQPCETLDQLQQWYEVRKSVAEQALVASGLISYVHANPNIHDLIGENREPGPLQVLVSDLPVAGGLAIVEAATGSGKTELALLHAWRLLAAGQADSIVFALPTQATANAMLGRLEKLATVLFENSTNLILAHGRANYQESFIALKEAAKPKTEQGNEEALVQCAEWLAQSRKRVFLGQIGVCTVDQVMVSVLPVRHNFVRGFGIGRSVLIVDEVHAYDAYMYGLLGGVLQQQKLSGGSAILLSATLPSHQKQKLAKAWGYVRLLPNQMSYPLITQLSEVEQKTTVRVLALPEKPVSERPIIDKTVAMSQELSADLLPSVSLKQRILSAVGRGAQVCVICNLVDVAQGLFAEFQQRFEETGMSNDQIDLFHSRFTFLDRQQKEQKIINTFGRFSDSTVLQSFNPNRKQGHLLIATQVVEQSLDICFDWMITQLCPVDLLFQRLGRLHRHTENHEQRPDDFQTPQCTILGSDSDKFDLHEVIYGNSRVLWRTQTLLQQAVSDHGGHVEFPDAYRKWIEPVYQEAPEDDEPESVTASFEKFEGEQFASQSCAKRLMFSDMSELKDSDGNISTLTRDGEMSLSIVPFYLDSSGRKYLLDGREVAAFDESEYWEAINLNTVSVPKSWERKDKSFETVSKDGLVWLEFEPESTVGEEIFYASFNNLIKYRYSCNDGLRRQIKEDK